MRPATECELAAPKAANMLAKGRAAELRELVEDARSKGATSLRAMAEHFNTLGIGTPRGGKWAAASVVRLLVQLAGRAPH